MTERLECARCGGIMEPVNDVLRCCDCNGKKVAEDEDVVMRSMWTDYKGRAKDKEAPANVQQFILE